MPKTKLMLLLLLVLLPLSSRAAEEDSVTNLKKAAWKTFPIREAQDVSYGMVLYKVAQGTDGRVYALTRTDAVGPLVCAIWTKNSSGAWKHLFTYYERLLLDDDEEQDMRRADVIFSIYGLHQDIKQKLTSNQGLKALPNTGYIPRTKPTEE